MAFRNRTDTYIQFRNDKKRQRQISGISVTQKSQHETKSALLGENGYEMTEMGENQVGLTYPPAWMSLVDEINYDISRLKKKMLDLSEAQKTSLLPQFGFDEKADDDQQTVEILTAEITKMFQGIQNKIQRIGAQQVKKQEKSVQKNLQSAFASQLQEQSVQFRKMQKDYLLRLRGKQQKGKPDFAIQDPENDDDLKYDVSFTVTQIGIVEQSESNISEREQQIIEIAKSINELAAIFKDLSTLVVEQGTILDRIDYNIETTDANVKKAIPKLRDAEKEQRKYRKKLCMLLLCLGILIMVLAVIIKISL